MSTAYPRSGVIDPAPEDPRSTSPRLLAVVVVFVGLVVAVVGSLGAPLITAVAEQYHVSLAAAQWTLTVALLSGAVATPVLGRFGSGPHRRAVVTGTLGAVVAGSALTVIPLPFALLLVGRAAQGVGFGLTPLMMATARDHLPEHRSARTIAVISVASIAGIGVGYPLAGLLTNLVGIRAAYALGLAITATALVAAIRALPRGPARPARRVDLRGALLLTAALLALLTVISQTGLWQHHPVLAGGVLAGSLLLVGGWAVLEARTDDPLVDIRQLRHPAIAAANLAMFTAGIGMYLLLSLITRYVQTPASAGYGFHLNAFQAGLVLVPFSALGFAAGRIVPRLRERLTSRGLLAAGATVVLAAFVLFAMGRGHLAEPVAAISVLGFGVGTFSAAMPAVILAAIPAAETASAMSVNMVVRSVSYAIGSAVGGLVLAAYTTDRFPRPAAYTTAAWTGAATTVATLLVIAAIRPAKGARG
jgi:predicted MFS family arabinose efflux permease